MSTKEKKQPQVPGEAPTQDEDYQHEEQPKTSGKTIEVSVDVLAEMQATIRRLEMKVENRSSPRGSAKIPDADLPDQSDIYQSLIKTPVLTKQGWVVPVEFGSQPKKG